MLEGVIGCFWIDGFLVVGGYGLSSYGVIGILFLG